MGKILVIGAAGLIGKEIVKALGESDLRDLEALMWFGRSDEDFAACRAHADTFPFDDGMRHYVAAKPLWDYLASAIEKWPGPLDTSAGWARS